MKISRHIITDSLLTRQESYESQCFTFFTPEIDVSMRRNDSSSIFRSFDFDCAVKGSECLIIFCWNLCFVLFGGLVLWSLVGAVNGPLALD